MDHFVKDLVQQWDLYEEIEDPFNCHEIDETTFNQLTESDIRELIPCLRVRKQFLAKYKDYKRLLEAASSDIILNSSSPAPTLSCSTSTSTFEEIDSIEENGIEGNNLVVGTVYPQKATLGLPYFISNVENSVKRLLDSSDEGLIIKKSYSMKANFERSKLCLLILKNELKGNLDKRISSERFRHLALEINEVFLHERPETYYVAYVNNYGGKPKSARGKLWSCYCNVRKNLRKLGLITRDKTKETNLLSELTETDETLDEKISWLKHNNNPFPQVQAYWEATAGRRKSIYKGTIEEYIRNFPILKEPSLGYQLLEIDFQKLYPGKGEKLFNKWPLLYGNILTLAKNSKDQYLQNLLKEKIDTVAEDILALLILPLLFKSVNIKSKKPALHWKPSKIEIKEAFLLEANNIQDLENKLTFRAQKYEKLKLNQQPVPVLIGEDPANFEFCCVCFNSIRYNVTSPLKAVDLCFKIFHSLNAEYPKEAEWVWIFIQNYVYEIFTPHDKKYVSVTTVMSDLEILQSDDVISQ